MAEMISTRIMPQSDAESEATIPELLIEMRRLNAQMREGQAESDRLKIETDALKSETQRLKMETRATLARLDAMVQ